ncbi:MAG: IS4 family transposase, partial [Campylobacterota bacterium]|nr:IS4 family transposase [Campylobacterota bacterium]
MNHNKKIIKAQQKISRNKLKNSNLDFIQSFINQDKLSEVLNNRNRIYTPQKTLCMFISQSLNQDGSCQNRVNKLALSKDETISINTSGYCKARQRLSRVAISTLTKSIAIDNEKKIPKNLKFRGRNIYLIDGTTITMPDTIENKKEYPHSKSQKDGLGFPICRIVAIISLATGSIIDANVGTYGGKGTGEQMLLRDMLHNFKKGDIILGDAMYSTYSLLSYALKHEIDLVFVQNGARARNIDFTQGEIITDDDHIITIKKPKQNPDWMSEDEIKEIPKDIQIREINTKDKILITTLLCPKKNPIKIIKNLYKERWHIEVDFRNIKITLDLKEFKCKTPKMVIKEMWVSFLAYNIIRSLMLSSALYNKIDSRTISFKSTLQLYLHYLDMKLFIQKDFKKLLKLISQKVIGNRAGRIEPRLLKKRCNAYRLLMVPRVIARANVAKNGHPK